MVPFRSRLVRIPAALLSWLLAVSLHAATTGSAEMEKNASLLIEQWLAKQTNIQTWQADVVQLRQYKTFARPLSSSGKVWFEAPNNFRWEVGSPPVTIAIRKEEELNLLYPRLKRLETFRFDDSGKNEWKESLSLLQAGFPRSRADLLAQFSISGLSLTNDHHVLTLIPRAKMAMQYIPRVDLLIQTNSSELAGTRLFFLDGSMIQNLFTNSVKNSPINRSLFEVGSVEGFKKSEPLK
ncbi:MAG: outer membrane lipoprotein carrier protein LolA [Verrucomicrobiota bacterium]|nr:outer membrane lipoprotein carrier protein LolA [Verrucomicrobiota bacterium]